MLACLRDQDAPPDRVELIVVDDGSTDGSTDGLAERVHPFPLRLIRQHNRGRAAARNTGVAEARGRAVLFLDADAWAEQGLIAAHLAAHRGAAGPLGVQGRFRQHPDSLQTLFMRATNLLPDLTFKRRRHLSPLHVNTRNFSVTAAVFQQVGGFDERFAGYGWEDIELGVRLRRVGVPLWYEPAASALHFHVQTLDQLTAKVRQAGEGAVYFWRKHGRPLSLGLFLEVAPVLLPLKWLVFRTRLITALVEAMLPWAERRALLPVCAECYNHLIWRAYYDGVFAALRDGGAARTG
jgi:GT2 family glycosyltransferase